MAMDAGLLCYVIPDPTATSATPAASNAVSFVGVAVKGGFFVPVDMDLVEFSVTFATTGTTPGMVVKLQVCRDTAIANAVDILGVPLVNPTTGVVTAAAAALTCPAAVAVGTTITKRFNYALKKGDFVLVNSTTAQGAGTGYFTIKGYPRGDAALGSKLQSTTVVSELLSTT